jgi:hypothetical protein
MARWTPFEEPEDETWTIHIEAPGSASLTGSVPPEGRAEPARPKLPEASQSGDVFWLDPEGRVIMQLYMTWTGERPNRTLSWKESEELVPGWRESMELHDAVRRRGGGANP